LNAFDIVERHQRIRLLCHAIRHLLDHCPENVSSGDVDAIDILQLAINPEDHGESKYGFAARLAPTPPAFREARSFESEELDYAL
jgi:hypothetical protein